MNIYLIRHGESTSDTKNKYDGDYDDHLTDNGLKEAEIIARKLLDSKIQIIFSSSKIRAIETSEILKNALKCKMEVTENINEQDIYGAYQFFKLRQDPNTGNDKITYPKGIEVQILVIVILIGSLWMLNKKPITK